MKYKGFFGRIEYVDDAKSFHGEIVGLKDIITFKGKSVDELEKAFHDSVDVYLAWCTENNEKPEKTFSGTFNLRIPPNLRARLAIQANALGVSLNTYVAEKLKT